MVAEETRIRIWTWPWPWTEVTRRNVDIVSDRCRRIRNSGDCRRIELVKGR